MTERRFFGTDGIRGRVGGDVINPEFVLKLGYSLGRTLANGSRAKVLIGKDTRISGYLLESALEAGLSAAGVDIHLMGPMPTPGVAYLTRTFRAQAGLVISASHNPFEDNGIKFFSADGFKLPDEVELEIERRMDEPMRMVASKDLGRAKRINDAAGRYVEYCKSTISQNHRFDGMKIVLDCANGATYDIAPHVFQELGATVIAIENRPDGFNINQGCGSTEPAKLVEAVRTHQADLGIAFDGDGDRVLMVDERGQLLDGDELIFIIASDRVKRTEWQGGIIGTQMSNFGLERALKEMAIPFERTHVGDRYVIEGLRERAWQLGGESSGHIICLNKTTTGDGIISALQILAAMDNQGVGLSELKGRLALLPQVRINVAIDGKAAHVVKTDGVMRAIDDAAKHFAGRGRVLVRPSGTEPLVRVMVEGDDVVELERYAEMLAEAVRNVAE